MIGFQEAGQGPQAIGGPIGSATFVVQSDWLITALLVALVALVAIEVLSRAWDRWRG